MLAFRRLLARRAPALRFCSSDSDSDFDFSAFGYFEAWSIEDQIKEIKKREFGLSMMIGICKHTISEKIKPVQKVFRETKKAPFEYLARYSRYPPKTPDVETMLEALEKWEDLKDVPHIDDCTSGAPDETKLLKAVETWENLALGFEDYCIPMMAVERDLKLFIAVRIMQARVNDVKKRLGNDEE